MTQTNLSEELAKILVEPEKNKDMNVDDFFDKFNIPKEARTDFAFATILDGAGKIIKSKENESNKDALSELGKSFIENERSKLDELDNAMDDIRVEIKNRSPHRISFIDKLKKCFKIIFK